MCGNHVWIGSEASVLKFGTNDVEIITINLNITLDYTLSNEDIDIPHNGQITTEVSIGNVNIFHLRTTSDDAIIISDLLHFKFENALIHLPYQK